MKLTKRQKEIIYGMILGDAYIQNTGKKNARLRVEQSHKQKEYIGWKYEKLKNLFQSEPKKLDRIHPASKKTYSYMRLQSNSSPFFGKMKQWFYDERGNKKLPDKLEDILKSPLTLAVWYMDDGYYDMRDKSAHIYVQRFESEELERITSIFKKVHNLNIKWYCRPDRKACQLNITGKDKDRFLEIINRYIITSMRYKTPLDPVTTENEN